MLRRSALLAPALLAWRDVLALPQKTLSFPRDHGSHPELRTEWWYLTGYFDAGTPTQPRLLGFQITFFRSRIDAAQSLNSRFAAKQLLFAHAALTDINAQKHWHDQRIARAGFGIAQASEQTADVKLRDWTLKRSADGAYTSLIQAKDFNFDLQFIPKQPLLLQGYQGLSRKGPEEKQASYYYSQPQLSATGHITHAGQQTTLQQGIAWLDHEWSEEILHPEAIGWDWIGMNLFDGSSLTAFQLRRKDGSALWAGGSFRDASATTIFKPSDVQFKAGDIWQSPSSAGRYPVQWQVITSRGVYSVRALMNAQELDSRSSTGTVYWEGLADLQDAQGKLVGRGYLEMTGYAGRLQI
ncbi:lipocalin-like domain-containing protein [Variovorax sp. PCZ-1]|uniref:lipocalin-like domain-containing protein n=1 Tax=Variovorax sp. PCZ-1 TaxID=2835533 RepID=UPI001BCC1176|nr:lipocalin-like domain-containing protein [Variovorax sp. PCZ-1]MBS7808163.1 carotenoid 1,2-hydratase [Variovorax sp. PCZ-1]